MTKGKINGFTSLETERARAITLLDAVENHLAMARGALFDENWARAAFNANMAACEAGGAWTVLTRIEQTLQEHE